MNARTVQALGVEKSLVAMYVGRLRAKQHGAVAAWGWRKTMEKRNMEITTYVRSLFIFLDEFQPISGKSVLCSPRGKSFIHPEAAQNWTVATRQALMI